MNDSASVENNNTNAHHPGVGPTTAVGENLQAHTGNYTENMPGDLNETGNIPDLAEYIFCQGIAHQAEIRKLIPPNDDFNSAIQKVENLDREGDYFWVVQRQTPNLRPRATGIIQPRTENLVLTQIKKVLVIANKVELLELHAAIHKWPKLKRCPVPLEVLQVFCCKMGLLVQDGWVSSKEKIEGALSLIEHDIVEVFSRTGGVAHRVELWQYIESRGHPKSTYETTMSISPIVNKVQKRVWRLTGTPASEAAVAAAIERGGPIEPPNTVADRARIKGNKIFVDVPITDRISEKGVCYVPKNVRNLLEGEFQAWHRGRNIGTARLIETELHGIPELLRSVSKELTLCFDLSDRTVRKVL